MATAGSKLQTFGTEVYPVGHPSHGLVVVAGQMEDYASGMAVGMMRGTVTPRAGAVARLENLGKPNPQIEVSVVTIAPDGKTVQTLRPASRMSVSEVGAYMTGGASAPVEPIIEKEASVPLPEVKQESLGAMLLGRQASTADERPGPPPSWTVDPQTVRPQLKKQPDVDPASLGPMLAAFMQALANNQAAAAAAPPAVIPPAIPAPVTAPAPPPDNNVFEALRIPQLGPVPRAPKSQVDFISKSSNFRHTAFYHWVMQEPSDLILAADSRYDYPFWCPPNMGAEVEFQVTVHTVEGARTYPCLLLGLNFNFGVFRFYQLVRTDGEQTDEQVPHG